MINKILKDLVRDYQDNQFINYNRDISFNQARVELLSNGTASFYLPETTILKNVTIKGTDYYAMNPLMADCNGIFDSVGGDGDYKVLIRDSRGMPLLEKEISND